MSRMVEWSFDDMDEGDWQKAPGFEFCRDTGGITARQYCVYEDRYLYRHWDSVAEFTRATGIKL